MTHTLSYGRENSVRLQNQQDTVKSLALASMRMSFVQAGCQPDGVISLKGLAISGFWIVRLPRVWDDPERRRAEKDPYGELDQLARTFKTTFDEWTKSVSM